MLVFGRPAGSELLPCTSLKLHHTLLLSRGPFNSSLARYFQPIHFYNLFLPREQTRTNPRDSCTLPPLQRCKKKVSCSTGSMHVFFPPLSLSLCVCLSPGWEECYRGCIALKWVSVVCSAHGRQVLRKRSVYKRTVYFSSGERRGERWWW